MAFDGPAESFIAAWVNGRLGPNKRKEAALSREVDGVVDTLYSYAVPIASIFRRDLIIVSDKKALERSSVTTSKHLRWVEQAVGGKGADATADRHWGGKPFPEDRTATLTQGRIPTNAREWEPILVAFDARMEGRPTSNLREWS